MSSILLINKDPEEMIFCYRCDCGQEYVVIKEKDFFRLELIMCDMCGQLLDLDLLNHAVNNSHFSSRTEKVKKLG